MKYLINLLCLLAYSFLTFAQNPNTISYQGVARNATGQPIPNQAIKIRLSLLETTGGSSQYTETHTLTTSPQGLFAVQMGAGAVISGTWAGLNWSTGPKFVKTEIDPTGGDNFTLATTSPLNAVPYALNALSGTPGPQGPPGPQGLKGDTGVAGPPGSFPSGNAVGDMQYWNGTQWVMIPIGLAGATLKNCDGTITWNPCKPKLITTGPTSVSATGIATGGNISSDGDAPITVRGMCWSTNPNPTTANSKTNDGSGIGSFARTISGLSLGTTYYIRAYATNIAGTAYGNELTVTTLTSTVPTLTTTAITPIDGNSANSGGNITSNGGAVVTVRGIVWDTMPNPTTSLPTKTTNGSGNGTFTSSMTGLIPNTVYYVRAYATNSAGTGYGNQITFTSPMFTVGGGVTDIDGNAYNTIILGTQEWMKENLKVSKYRNGEPIPTGLDDAAWASTTVGAFSIYNNSATNNTTFGKLYNFFAMVDPRNLCPTGWHEPTDTDWKTLEIYLGMDPSDADLNGARGAAQNIGGKLKSTSAVWPGPNTGANNLSGLTGLPGGWRDNNGLYAALNTSGFWWTKDICTSPTAWIRQLDYNFGYVSRYCYWQNYGLAVRCIKN